MKDTSPDATVSFAWGPSFHNHRFSAQLLICKSIDHSFLVFPSTMPPASIVLYHTFDTATCLGVKTRVHQRLFSLITCKFDTCQEAKRFSIIQCLIRPCKSATE